MFGRFLAICGWLAMKVRRPFTGPLSSLRRWAPYVVAGLLLILAAAPIVAPMFQAQPQDVTIQQILDGGVTESSRWVRLQGRVVPLTEAPADEPGSYGLFVDAADTLQAIVVRSGGQITRAASTAITGHLAGAIVAVEEDLPLEATVFGAPPAIIPNLVVQLDEAALPERIVLWPLSILPLLLAAVLVVGAAVGYPVFRPTSEVDVVSSPLAPGERVPAAFAGRLGPMVRDLADPGAALIVVRPGPSGNVLTAQPLSDDERPAPPPVPIGGGWSRGRIGWVYTVSEAVPALRLRAESIDATLLFAKTGERDRVAGLIAVDRD
jgi:hypothetical protein